MCNLDACCLLLYRSHLNHIFCIMKDINIAMSKYFAVNDNAFLKAENLAGDTGLGRVLSTLKILSYNVWFQDVEIDERMGALGDLIQFYSPDVICFQVHDFCFII